MSAGEVTFAGRGAQGANVACSLAFFIHVAKYFSGAAEVQRGHAMLNTPAGPPWGHYSTGLTLASAIQVKQVRG